MSREPKLATLRTCSQVWEAEILRDRLESAGIMAFVHGGETGRSLSYVGVALGGVRVQVPVGELERAEQVLVDDERQRIVAGRWRCPRCGEPNDASFDFCYSCSMPRDENAASDDGSDEDAEEQRSPPPSSPVDGLTVDRQHGDSVVMEDHNPYRSPSVEPVGSHLMGASHLPLPHLPTAHGTSERLHQDSAAAELSVQRALRWAVFGCVFPMFVLQLISLGCLYQGWRDGAAEVPALRRRMAWILGLNLLIGMPASLAVTSTMVL